MQTLIYSLRVPERLLLECAHAHGGQAGVAQCNAAEALVGSASRSCAACDMGGGMPDLGALGPVLPFSYRLPHLDKTDAVFFLRTLHHLVMLLNVPYRWASGR